MTNALTIDVEDYFQVSAFEPVSPPDSWSAFECRVERNTMKILDILDAAGVKATFFILGWVSEQCPGLAKKIADAKHEIASHGYWHRRVYTQTREEFRDDVRRAKNLLEEQTGVEVAGYRAPSYSISQESLWAFDELAEAGYRYDSSVFPIKHDLYGMPFWPRFPFHVERLGDGNWVPAEGGEALPNHLSAPLAAPLNKSNNGCTLLEIPITTVKLFDKNFPLAGGGYFRFFPYGATRWGLNRINRKEGKPFVFYLHPWEVDPAQPRMKGASAKSRFRHYVNLSKTESRLKKLLKDFSFAPIREALLDNLSENGASRGGTF